MTSAKLLALGLSFMLSSLIWFPSISAADARVTLTCVGGETCQALPTRQFYDLPEDRAALISDIQACIAEDVGCRPNLAQTGAKNVITATCVFPSGAAQRGVFEIPGEGRDLGAFNSNCGQGGGDLTISSAN